MKDIIQGLAWLVIGLTSIVSFFHAVWVDASNGDIAWVIADVLVTPLGVIRGFLMLIGVM